MSRLDTLLAMNPDFAKAYRRGEKWALLQADAVQGLDGNGSRKFPERSFRQDGKPRNWCGTCSHPEGCITCDLPGDYSAMKGLIGTDGRFRNWCGECLFAVGCVMSECAVLKERLYR